MQSFTEFTTIGSRFQNKWFMLAVISPVRGHANVPRN